MAEDTIKVGDDQVIFNLPVLSKGVIVPIMGATVTLHFITGNREFYKNAIITDGPSGICQTTLTSVDLSTAGKYWFQATIVMDNNKGTFTSDPIWFNVEDKI